MAGGEKDALCDLTGKLSAVRAQIARAVRKSMLGFQTSSPQPSVN